MRRITPFAVLLAFWAACGANKPTPQPASPRLLTGRISIDDGSGRSARQTAATPNQVIAEGTDGTRVTAGIDPATGEFAAALFVGTTYVVRFATLQEATETESSVLLFESSPGGSLTSLLPMARAPDGGLSDVGLGRVALASGQALPERNPLAQVDADQDGVSDPLSAHPAGPKRDATERGARRASPPFHPWGRGR